VLPILNKRRFLQQIEDGTVPLVLLFSVLVVAYRYVKPKDMHITVENENFEEYLYKQVMTYLRCYVSKSVIHIIQANVLMVTYLDLEDNDTESLQWYALGAAIRMAQELGLHRSSAHWRIPKSEIETRHRLFFACYILDRW
jgi:Fungal specific transcription factor domain